MKAKTKTKLKWVETHGRRLRAGEIIRSIGDGERPVGDRHEMRVVSVNDCAACVRPTYDVEKVIHDGLNGKTVKFYSKAPVTYYSPYAEVELLTKVTK